MRGQDKNYHSLTNDVSRPVLAFLDTDMLLLSRTIRARLVLPVLLFYARKSDRNYHRSTNDISRPLLL